MTAKRSGPSQGRPTIARATIAPPGHSPGHDQPVGCTCVRPVAWQLSRAERRRHQVPAGTAAWVHQPDCPLWLPGWWRRCSRA
jgi:hypothetical protein